MVNVDGVDVMGVGVSVGDECGVDPLASGVNELDARARVDGRGNDAGSEDGISAVPKDDIFIQNKSRQIDFVLSEGSKMRPPIEMHLQLKGFLHWQNKNKHKREFIYKDLMAAAKLR